MCEQRRYTVAVHEGGPSHTSLTRHTRKGATREMTGRASDGSDSYSYSCMWSACGCMRLSYQRGEQLCCRGRSKGVERLSRRSCLSTPSSSPAMLTRTDNTHVKGDWFPLHRCSWRPRQWSSTGVHRATSVHPAAVSCAPCDTVHTHPAKHRKQGAVWHPLSACRLRAHTPSTFTCTPPSTLQRERRDPTHVGAGASVTRSIPAVRGLARWGGAGGLGSC